MRWFLKHFLTQTNQVDWKLVELLVLSRYVCNSHFSIIIDFFFGKPHRRLLRLCGVALGNNNALHDKNMNAALFLNFDELLHFFDS